MSRGNLESRLDRWRENRALPVTTDTNKALTELAEELALAALSVGEPGEALVWVQLAVLNR